MINLFVKVDDITMTIYLEENKIIDNKTLLIKILNKFFIKKGFNNILDKVGEDKIDFFKILYLTINSKYIKFSHEYEFKTNNLKDITAYMNFTNCKPQKFKKSKSDLIKKIFLNIYDTK
jgi:hypothetical protein